MLLKETLKQVRQIEIRTTRLVNDLFGGEYQSVFKGRGMEFSEVREYVPGDDIRTIDWNVTARSQGTFVKKFVEERELTVIFVVDGSASLQFGSRSKFKSSVAAELAGLLAFSAIKNNDKVGLLIFTDQIERFVPPKKGKSHVLRVVREILGFKPLQKKTNIRLAIEHLYRMVKRSAVIFVISDFMDEGYEKAFKILNQKNDLIAIQLADEREEKLPKLGWMALRDRETNRDTLVNLSNAKLRQAFEKQAQKKHEQVELFFKLAGIDTIQIHTDESYVKPLIKFFRNRERRR